MHPQAPHPGKSWRVRYNVGCTMLLHIAFPWGIGVCKPFRREHVPSQRRSSTSIARSPPAVSTGGTRSFQGCTAAQRTPAVQHKHDRRVRAGKWRRCQEARWSPACSILPCSGLQLDAATQASCGNRGIKIAQTAALQCNLFITCECIRSRPAIRCLLRTAAPAACRLGRCRSPAAALRTAAHGTAASLQA